ncbi:RsmB/NOP family class I SAM-dependent RNA methyltransferase [Candidatus Pacearchaeota archaeon]|nr:RsmB/NOP family class I SAM-dependent RNA methyltransferase [Candidatus Pacearchaeota archaeon]
MKYEPKPKFLEHMKKLLDNKEDLQKYLEVIKTKQKKSIRVNTLKIDPETLKKTLQTRGWDISQPCDSYPEIIRIESNLEPGEIGKTKEHLLGYYYSQEITSMMPILALNPQPNDILFDCCAAPGSKTTQAAAIMENKGTIIANDVTIGRIIILSSNLERCGVTNTMITRHDAIALSNRLQKVNMLFDKILVDAPCSGEGNIRVSPRTLLEWSEGLIKGLSKKQKKIAQAALNLLKPGGEMIYSTCTHAPEENESVVQHLLDNNKDLEIIKVDLPIKSRPGLTQWNKEKFSNKLRLAHRIYPHDNDMEGFFLCKLRKKEN